MAAFKKKSEKSEEYGLKYWLSPVISLPRRTVLELCKGKRPKLAHARLDYWNFRFSQADLDAYIAKRTVVAR